MDRIELNGSFESKEGQKLRSRLNLLYGTMAGECALDRDFGIDWSYIDEPLPIAKARMTNEIIEKTMSYEGDYAEVESVDGVVDASGRLIMKVVVKCHI